MSSVWENKYHELFGQFNLAKKRHETNIQLERNNREDMEEERFALKSALAKLGEEISQKDDQISQVMRDRVNMTKNLLDVENALIETKSALVACERENRDIWENFSNDEEKRQTQIEQLVNELQEKSKETEILKEKNQEVLDTLNEYKDGLRAQKIKIFNNYDILFSKYMEAFPNDEPNLRAVFQDPVSQGSNLAFQMLIQLCFDDISLNIGDIIYYVNDSQNMVEEIVKHELYIRFCQYARVLQFKNAHLYHDTSDAFSKNKELTRHKIAYEEVEIVTARTQFVLSLINVVTLSNESQKEKHGSKKHKKKKAKNVFDKPIGFDKQIEFDD